MLESYKNFFVNGSGFPKFKSKHDNKQSCRFPEEAISSNNDYSSGKLTLTKSLKNVKFRCSDEYKVYLNKYKSGIKSATLTKTKSGNYFLSVLIDKNKKLEMGGTLKYKDFLKMKKNEEVATQELENNDGILVVVDVQGEFSDFIPQGFEQNIVEYCQEFPKDDNGKGVYQIWDANKATGFTYTFPNQILAVMKHYGTKFDDNIRNISFNKLPQDSPEGKLFKFGDSNRYLVKVNNNHGWFYVPEELYNLYQTLKGKTVIVVGGADSECLQDVYISMKSFGVVPVYNHNFIYNATTNDDQKTTDKTPE
jgi:hypothetical protein